MHRKPTTIFVGADPVAIAFPVEGGVRFFAVQHAVWGLDGKVFGSVGEATLEAVRVFPQPNRKRKAADA
jgi:hypothetical protein